MTFRLPVCSAFREESQGPLAKATQADDCNSGLQLLTHNLLQERKDLFDGRIGS